ncbi:MAG: glycosyltransferase family 2 protein [Pseudodesulfovibrio sp.]|uniref:glycosyltransferase family 2 protein n=1 Tax=Pseudodesulfovibrio sp. TaxID=2035812 RepID=UPI003D13B247
MAYASVAIVIVHYGRVETTLRCLERVFAVADGAFVVVSNNGTPEQAGELAAYAQSRCAGGCLSLDGQPGSPERDALADASVAIVHNSGNRGFAAGCNAGIRLAQQRGGIGHVWLLNNDALPEAGALEALLECGAAHPAAVLGATVIDMNAAGEDGPWLQLAGGVRYNRFTTCIHPAHAGAPLSRVDALPEPELDYVYGASLFAPVELFQRAGLLDEAFFLFYEELDLCRRATALGYVLRWCRGARVGHAVSGSVGRPGEATRGQERNAAFHEARSLMLFTRKHHAWLLPLALLARLAAKPLVLAGRGQWHCIGPVFRGVCAGLAQRPLSER